MNKLNEHIKDELGFLRARLADIVNNKNGDTIFANHFRERISRLSKKVKEE